jgi:ElaA protein
VSFDLQWSFLPFSEFSAPELYEVLQLRSEVFVVEQACAFQDMDGADQQSMHLLGKSSAGQLQAYARCLPPGLKFKEASIGRVLTCEALRGQGAGHVLMRQAIAQVTTHWGPQAIRIGAQSRLQAFYQQLGFAPVGQPYIEDGIPHIEMLRP